MKKVLSFLTAGVMLFGLTACSGEGSPLTKSSAKSALKKEAVFAKDSQVASFNLGFQEISESEFNDLVALKAAGVVDYTLESVVEYRENRVWGGYWGRSYTETVEVTHVFANVSLTPEGQKYVITEPTKYRKDLAEILKANDDYEEFEPAYLSVSDDAYQKLIAKKPAKVEEPVVEEVVEEIYDDLDTVAVEEVVEEVVEEAPAHNPNQVRTADNKNAAYEAMVARVNTEEVLVLLGHFEIDKVREVLCTEEMFKDGKGTCKVYYKFVDKTPFGYVLGAPKADYLMSATVKFIHYQDLGWVVDNE